MTSNLPSPERLTEAQAAEAFSGPARRSNNGARYPWDDWFDGQAYMLSKEIHFPSVKSLRIVHAMIRKAAGQRGIKVRCRRYEDLGKIAVQKVQDAPHKDVATQGKSPRKILRDRKATSERGKQQPGDSQRRRTA